MSRHQGFCAGTNRNGKPCGNKVPTLPSGVVIRRYCWIHRKRTRLSERTP